MNHRDRSIIDGVRQRALLADQKRKALLEQRRELDATISALTEATDLSKGEIEKISADVQREVFKEESEHGRNPTVLGATLVVVLSWGTLVLFSESDETTYAAAIPMQAAASARSSNAATASAAAKRDDAHLIPGLSEESRVHVYGVHEGKQSEEDARRVQAQRDTAVDAIRGAASMGGGVPVRTARSWTRIEESPGYVTVQLPAAEHPIILVLAARRSVNWTVDPAPGARIEHVILSGKAEQFVSGVPDDVPVTAFSSATGNRLEFYAFKKQNSNYAKLVHDILRLTNKPVHRFRGEYKGDVFRSGYRKEIVTQETPEDSVTKEPNQEKRSLDTQVTATEEPSNDAAPPPVTRKIHRWVDESGRVHYADKAPASTESEQPSTRP